MKIQKMLRMLYELLMERLCVEQEYVLNMPQVKFDQNLGSEVEVVEEGVVQGVELRHHHAAEDQTTMVNDAVIVESVITHHTIVLENVADEGHDPEIAGPVAVDHVISRR